jgi:arginyl-tRNA synthetase
MSVLSPTTSISPFDALPKLPNTDFSHSKLDGFRVAAATHIHNALKEYDLSLEDVFAGVDLAKQKSDFTVAVPRFRIKGASPKDLVKKVVDSVRPVQFV